MGLDTGITVWCVFNGTKYTEKDVIILRDMVAANMVGPYRFRCLSDREIPGVDCLIPCEQWPGWWSKLLLFRYSTGTNLYLDLDVVVVGALDPLISAQTLSMPANWGQSGHGGCQSSVMSWAQPYRYIADWFDPDAIDPPDHDNCGRYAGLWGDQEYITTLMGDPGQGDITAMEGIYSYKYHCRGGLPADACVVCFHGNPKPSEVRDQWVIDSRSMQTPA